MKNELTANRLNDALQDVGMTAQELARQSGVSKASISQYRNGVHAPNNISAGKMAKVLNVNPLWLMGFNVPKYEPSDDYSALKFFAKRAKSLSDDERFIISFMGYANNKEIKRLKRYVQLMQEEREEGDHQ